MSKMLPILRDLQSRFALVLEAKTDMQRYLRRMRKTPFEYEYSILQHLASNGRSVIDVGANRGQSIEAVRLYHKQVAIHSFEPSGILSEKLSHRYASDNLISIKNLALGSQVSSEKLYVPYYRNFMYDGLASFTKSRAENWLNADTVWRFNPAKRSLRKLNCNVALLDSYNLDPFFLKIHVQGFESEVLAGGEKLIEKSKPVLLLAYNEDAHFWLINRGWQKFRYYEGRLKFLDKPDPELYNCIYLNPSHTKHSSLIRKLS